MSGGERETTKRLSDALRQRAREILEWPLAEMDADGVTVQPANWNTGDAPKLLQLALEIEGQEAVTLEPGSLVPGQVEAARGKRYFFEYLAERFPNVEDVYRLMQNGWDWRKSVYITWLATPKQHRQPQTQAELATEYLNLTSDRTLRNWRKNRQWPIDETARQLVMNRASSPAPDRLADVIAAMYDTASMRGRNGTADRKMILQMLRLIGGDGEQVAERNEFEQYDDTELNNEIARLDEVAAITA